MKTDLAQVVLDPYSMEFLQEPYPHFESLREAAPVFFLPQYGVYGTARYAEVKQVLSDHDTFCSSRGVGIEDFRHVESWRGIPSRILEVDPPVHSQNRSVLNKVLNQRKLRELKEEWRPKAQAVVADLAQKGRFDAVADLGKVFPLSVFPDAVGLRPDGRENLLPYGELGFNAFGPDNELRRNALAAAAPIMAWVAESCDRENLAPGGFGRSIYELVESEGLAEEEAPLLVRSLLAAGLDTTVNGISALVYCLAAHPDEYQRLKKEPALRKSVFEEVLRWVTPAQTFFRTATRDTELSGTSIPEGSKMLVFLGAANRDPRQWEDGDRFDAGRRPSGHVAFGHGVHSCVGQMVARTEAELVLEAMLEHWQELRLAGQPRFRLNNTLRSFDSVPVVVG